MRRSDREITDMDRIMEIVRRQGVCCVAFQNTPCPYLIPMNYGAALENGWLTLYFHGAAVGTKLDRLNACLLYTSPSPRDRQKSRMPSSA